MPQPQSGVQISTTVRFTLDEHLANEELVLDLRRQCGRHLKRAEVDRALWRLVRKQPAAWELLLGVLGAAEIAAGSPDDQSASGSSA